MKVELEKRYPVAAPPDAAWTLLKDIEAVAACMPGARIVERVDERNYKGALAMRIGPAAMAFKGDIAVLALDEAARTVHLQGKGADSTGGSAAAMDLTARVEAEGAASVLVGRSEVSVNGKAAAFGARMMNTVAEQVLQQFAGNFARRAAEAAGNGAAAGGGGMGDAAAGGALGGVGGTAGGGAAGGGTAGGGAPGAAGARTEPEPANELDGLALLWAVVKSWFAGLFRRA